MYFCDGMKTFLQLLVCLCFFSHCANDPSINAKRIDTPLPVIIVRTDTLVARDTIPAKSEIELKLEALGLIDIAELDSSLHVDLRYSTTRNFTGKDMYGDLNRCYFQPDVAVKLVKAQALLKLQFPSYSLLILDGARPVSIQQYMWDSVNLLPINRQKYLSNPANKSLHNYGAAVDVTIVDSLGIELDMGTPYDYFGDLAQPRKEDQFVADGTLTDSQLEHRQLLRSVMCASGFSRIETEWWHFNSTSRLRASEIYPVID